LVYETPRLRACLDQAQLAQTAGTSKRKDPKSQSPGECLGNVIACMQNGST